MHDLNAVLPNADGFTTYQNVPAIIATRGNGTTIQGLLDNDHVSDAPNKKQSNYHQSEKPKNGSETTGLTIKSGYSRIDI